MKKGILSTLVILTLVISSVLFMVSPALAISMSGGTFFKYNFQVMQQITINPSNIYVTIMAPTVNTEYQTTIQAPSGISMTVSPTDVTIPAGTNQNIVVNTVTVNDTVPVGIYTIYMTTSEVAGNGSGIQIVGAIRWFAYVSVIQNPNLPVITAPFVTGITTSGNYSTDGGNSVTISGANFVSGATASIGNPATNVNVISSTSITATTSANPAGYANVTVTNPDGQSFTLTNAVYFITPQPVITGISPKSGPTGGGTQITITGTDLSGATSIWFFNSSDCYTGTIVSDSATQLVCKSPQYINSTGGTVDIQIITAGGGSSTGPTDQFTYLDPPPVTTSTTVTPTTTKTTTTTKTITTTKTTTTTQPPKRFRW